jgi:hypothetical protein
MTHEESQIKTNYLLEKLGDKYTKNGIEYYIKNVMPQPKENEPNEYIVLVHLASKTVTNFFPIEYDDFIRQYSPIV